tara:strand:+ start:915 stop:1112 length:198 start_codon:yes stop_codon:yes gene_type:complete
MKTYEVTQYVLIPASVTVKADNARDAATIGIELLNETGGEQGEQFWDNSVRVWDGGAVPALEYDW